MASAGNDHNDGEPLKSEAGLCERNEPKVNFDGEVPRASEELWAYEVAVVDTEAEERVKVEVEEVLGLGGDPSSGVV